MAVIFNTSLVCGAVTEDGGQEFHLRSPELGLEVVQHLVQLSVCCQLLELVLLQLLGHELVVELVDEGKSNAIDQR